MKACHKCTKGMHDKCGEKQMEFIFFFKLGMEMAIIYKGEADWTWKGATCIDLSTPLVSTIVW